MRKTVFTVGVTFLLTVLLTVGIIGAGAVYYVGGYFADMTFRRGMPGYPKAPPAVFRTVFVSNGGAMQPAAKPRNFADEEQ